MADYEFDWDDANESHLARHDVTPNEFEEVIERPNAEVPTNPGPNGEARVKLHGTTAAARFLTAIYTERGTKIRPVTAYDTSRKDRKQYAEQILAEFDSEV